MADLPTFTYEPLIGSLPNGQEVLVQLFRDPTDGHLIDAQIAFRRWSWDSWGIPVELKVAP